MNGKCGMRVSYRHHNLMLIAGFNTIYILVQHFKCMMNILRDFEQKGRLIYRV